VAKSLFHTAGDRGAPSRIAEGRALSGEAPKQMRFNPSLQNTLREYFHLLRSDD
jgi:hypothetical protein